MKDDSIRSDHEDAIDAVFALGDVPKAALDLINTLLSAAEDVESERDEAIEEVEELREGLSQRDSAQDEALIQVRYYLIDILSVILRDPKRLLRVVEDVL